MRILLTGGCGDLGSVLAPRLETRGDTAVILDLREPRTGLTSAFIHGSILERDKLQDWLRGVDIVVHIAAWHGIHEVKNEKDAYEFFDLNIRGTFEIFEAVHRTAISGIILISSTSVDAPDTVYGNSKIIAEQIASFYATHHRMKVLTLRPRAFIPHHNRLVYSNYIEWAKWFWKGAVHINDVASAVEKAIDFISSNETNGNLIVTIDGAYEYSDYDLENWDESGKGTTFQKYYPEFFDLAKAHGLPVEQRPRKLDIKRTKELIGYEPTFSLRNLLEELKEYGEAGPPSA